MPAKIMSLYQLVALACVYCVESQLETNPEHRAQRHQARPWPPMKRVLRVACTDLGAPR